MVWPSVRDEDMLAQCCRLFDSLSLASFNWGKQVHVQIQVEAEAGKRRLHAA